MSDVFYACASRPNNLLNALYFNPKYHKIRCAVKMDAFILSEMHLKPQSYSLFVL
jgi:hypothetical protein